MCSHWKWMNSSEVQQDCSRCCTGVKCRCEHFHPQTSAVKVTKRTFCSCFETRQRLSGQWSLCLWLTWNQIVEAEIISFCSLDVCFERRLSGALSLRSWRRTPSCFCEDISLSEPADQLCCDLSVRLKRGVSNNIKHFQDLQTVSFIQFKVNLICKNSLKAAVISCPISGSKSPPDPDHLLSVCVFQLGFWNDVCDWSRAHRKNKPGLFRFGNRT